MLRSDLCDYSNAYIVVKGRISVRGNNANNRENKKLTFKNKAPFRSCISKTKNTFICNGDLDVGIPMHNLLEYSDNYSMTSGSLQNYCRDEVNDNTNENNAGNYRINNNKITTSKSFKYKAIRIGSTLNDNNTLDT